RRVSALATPSSCPLPPPPTSTLFPYHDALPIYARPHRRKRDRWPLPQVAHPYPGEDDAHPGDHAGDGGRVQPLDEGGVQAEQPRSEEHTSELQSREKLGCRLLLEKKNTPSKTRW